VTVHTFSLADYSAYRSLVSAKKDLTWKGEMSLDARVIIEVGWVADDALLVKEIDRAARKGSVVLFEGGSSKGKVVRILGKDGEEGDDGWIEHVSLLPCCCDVA
jgi:dipeptidyl aminopeptidase